MEDSKCMSSVMTTTCLRAMDATATADGRNAAMASSNTASNVMMATKIIQILVITSASFHDAGMVRFRILNNAMTRIRIHQMVVRIVNLSTVVTRLPSTENNVMMVTPSRGMAVTTVS